MAVVFIYAIVVAIIHGVSSDPWAQSPSEDDLSMPVVEFHVQEINSVMENQIREVSFGINWENASRSGDLKGKSQEFLVLVMSENSKIMEVVNGSSLCVSQNDAVQNYTFSVRGVFLGYTKVHVNIRRAPLGCDHLHINVDQDVVSEAQDDSKNFLISVSVIRYPSVLVDIVTGIMAALVAFNYINMGVQLNMQSICKVLKKPIGPTIGFVCQFLFMPLASYGISYILLDDVSLRLGLFTLGCSPGGSMSNFWTLLFKGDVNLSVTMTFISTIAALAMMPLWIFTLGKNLFRNRAATIPYINLAGSLVILTIPIGFGLLIQQYSPRLTKLSEKIIKPVTLLCVVFGVFVGLYANSFVFQLFTWRVVLSGIGIAWGGYSFGALTAWLFRLDRSQIVAVSIETAFQNPAVAFVMLLMSLPQPEADLTSVPVIAQLMLTGLPMWALLVITRIYDKCFKSKNHVKDIEDLEEPKEYVPVEGEPPREDEVDNNNYLSLIPNGNGPKPQIVRMSSS